MTLSHVFWVVVGASRFTTVGGVAILVDVEAVRAGFQATIR